MRRFIPVLLTFCAVALVMPWRSADAEDATLIAEDPPGYCACCPRCKVERGAKTCEAACESCAEMCPRNTAKYWTCTGSVACAKDPEKTADDFHDCDYSAGKTVPGADVGEAKEALKSECKTEAEAKHPGPWRCHAQLACAEAKN